MPSLDFTVVNQEVSKEIETAMEQDGLEYGRSLKTYNVGDYFIPGEHADVSVITDDSIDRDGEVMDVKSIDWSSYRKNPIVVFGHKYDNPPIGKSIWQKFVSDKFWKAKTVYSERPGDYPAEKEWFPDTVFNLIKNGFLLAKSIGGLHRKIVPTSKDFESNPHWVGAKAILKNVKVFEYSVVTCQSNTNAVVEVVSKGLVKFDEEILKKEFPQVYEMVKDVKSSNLPPAPPIIKSFRTATEYNNEVTSQFKKELEGIHSSIPTVVEDVLARMLGRV